MANRESQNLARLESLREIGFLLSVNRTTLRTRIVQWAGYFRPIYFFRLKNLRVGDQERSISAARTRRVFFLRNLFAFYVFDIVAGFEVDADRRRDAPRRLRAEKVGDFYSILIFALFLSAVRFFTIRGLVHVEPDIPRNTRSCFLFSSWQKVAISFGLFLYSTKRSVTNQFLANRSILLSR